jgi:two-component system, chemotaxis family, CheB/CheR fusion protein
MQDQGAEVNPLWIVGIGASAGGLPAISAFFDSLPNPVNAAFVVVQHLSPDFPSALVNLLQQHTQMKVCEITDGMVITANTVYVVSPNHILTLEGDRLRVESHTRPIDRDPIDHFFQSLAVTGKDRGIGILFSGTGHDGTKGLQAISRSGGIALVQSAETAQFTSMVTSALPSGLVDEILSPQELADAVCGLIEFAADYTIPVSEDQGLIDPDRLQQILAILLEHEQVDFSQYKPGTLSRHILHRSALTRCASLADYTHLLEGSVEEQGALRQDLLIGVTRFFRDPSAWEIIATEVLPQMIDRLKPEQPLRIWIPACATGEEAYTMAMLVDEAIARTGRTISVKIFATDLDAYALRAASKGIYAASIANQISPERLEHYFDPQGEQFHVKRSLREMLVFAPHDLARNAGFSGMHLVSCRNVLIYMQPELQLQVLRLLHFALMPQGILFLGSSETLGEMASEFLTLDQICKIYRKRRDAVLLSGAMPRMPIVPTFPQTSQRKGRQRQLDRWVNGAFQFCFAHRKMTCLLVNRDNQLLHVFYNSAELLTFPVGEAHLEVTEVVMPALRLPLSTALHRAKREQQTVLYTGIKLDREDRQETITLHVGFSSPPPNDTDFLIVQMEIEKVPLLATKTQDFEMDAATGQYISELEYELQQTRENLQVTIEELETTNEEQQASNEELLAANEELESTNEELQSVNEELYTVNAEYQTKIHALTRLTNDIDNLLRSTEIGVVFLDSQLTLRKFTPAATQIINILPSDEGRPLKHFTNNLDCPDFIDLLQNVISGQHFLEREVTLATTDEHLLMRVNPYLDEDSNQDGIVITFVNIDKLKQAQTELYNANAMMESLFTTSPVGLSLFDRDWRLLRINQAQADMNGYSVEAHIGKTLSELLPGLAKQILPTLRKVIKTGKSIRSLEINGRTPASPDADRHWIASYFPVELPDGGAGLWSVVTDITELKRAE